MLTTRYYFLQWNQRIELKCKDLIALYNTGLLNAPLSLDQCLSVDQQSVDQQFKKNEKCYYGSDVAEKVFGYVSSDGDKVELPSYGTGIINPR